MRMVAKLTISKKELLPYIFILTLGIFTLAYADTASTGANIGNSAPVASSVQIAAGNLDSGEVLLTSNQTTQLNFTAVITDNNGCTEISAVNATFFRTNITYGDNATDNNRTHYSMECTVQSGTCTGAGDIAATYDCNMNATWYLDPTDSGSYYASTNWTINVTPYDATGIGTHASNIYDVKTLTSFTLQSTSINFGALGLGGNTTNTNQNISIANLGNEPIDISLTGYGNNSGDNLSMICTLGNVTIGLLEYSNAAFTYGSGVDLSNSSTELDFDLDRGSEGTPRPESVSYYGFAVPSDGVAGSCTGNLVIVATSDPNLD